MAERKFRIIQSAAEDIQDQAIASAEAAAQQIESAANEIAEYARSASERLEDWGKDSYQSAKSAVQEDPVLWSAISIGVVALAGLAATWLSTRNRSSRRRRARPSPAQLRTRRAAKSKRSRSARQQNAAEASDTGR
jgi:hypothetical protein